MSRPRTLCSVAEHIRDGVPESVAIPEFMDEFIAVTSRDARLAMMMEEPPFIGMPRIDALLGAIAEYLAKQNRLAMVPPWAGHAGRCLEEPWFTTDIDSPGMKEYLAWASPAEFRHHNIFTAEVPLRRAGSREGA
ncbi:MAG: hypothetical protein ABT940_05575 [Alphaproteobacteria bacterium]